MEKSVLEILEDNGDSYNFGHLMLACLRNRPDAINQIDAATGEQETNASVLCRSIRLAKCLRRLGLKPGDIITVGGRNHLDLHIPIYAALFNGLAVAGVDPFFKTYEIKNILKLTEPKSAFCESESYEDYAKSITELKLDTKIITFGGVEHSLTKFIDEYDDKQPESDFTVATFDMSKTYFWLTSTGGTTGTPKLAAYRQKEWIEKIASFYNLRALYKKEITDLSNRRALNLSPIQWISGMACALSMPLMQYCKIQTSAPATIEHAMDIINKYKPKTGMFGPPFITSILKHEKECDLTCFDLMLITGSKIGVETINKLKARMRKDAVAAQTYGQSENLGPALELNPFGPPGSCGKPMSSIQYRLVDPETGKIITEPNVAGELWTKGPTFIEYYRNPEETAKAFTEDGWYKTGDLLYRDKDDNYFFVDRLKLLIKCRSYQILPGEIEDLIRSHPEVLEVCVTSVPHPEDYEHPVACVVMRPGSHVTADDIKHLVADNLSESKQLKGGVMFLDSMPLTSAGKFNRSRVREIALSNMKDTIV